MTNHELLQSAEQYMHSLSEEVYSRIEVPNWSPWLQADSSQLAERMRVFPLGHMLFKDEANELTGFLSTNRISWDGNDESLTTWDEVAGNDNTFVNSYQPTGNTVCLMSMGVAAGSKGQQIAQKMIAGIQEIARKQGVEHIIGDFRPSGYGMHKHMTGSYDFDDYIAKTRADGLPLDPWLRNVTYQGMRPLKVDHRAMVVPATAEELFRYMKEFKPGTWYEIDDPSSQKVLMEQHKPELNLSNVTNIFECEETGTWYLDSDNGQAVYIESNLWGELPL